MNRFFFVSTYDTMSAEILASLINIHPDIQCNINSTDGHLPGNISSTLDKHIGLNTSSSHKISGCIGSGVSAFELHNRIISERTSTPFKKINIMLSPISRIRLMMYSWINTGIPLEILVQKLYEELEKKTSDENNVLYKYYVGNIYRHFVTIISKQLNELQKLAIINPECNETLQKIQGIGSHYGMLFLLAFTITYAYDMADLPIASKNCSFEKIITDEIEFVNFINYLTHNKIEWSEENKKVYYKKCEEINDSISKVLQFPWEEWQELLVINFINSKFEFFYGAHINKPLIEMYEECGYSFAKKQEVQYSKLLSIQLNSCRPVQMYTYFDNIEETVDNPSDIEIIVNIDHGDKAMKDLLEAEIKVRKFTIKYIESPRPKSYFDLWKPLNEIIKITDPNAYFLLNVSDEMLFLTKGWDTVLKSYVGLYPDHLFRLRLSRNKFRNYFDRWECNFAQDSCPITTKKWVDIGGDWNPCFGPDSFQQLVSFYLAKDGQYISKNYLRDIPVHDIKLRTDIPEIGMQEEKRWKHQKYAIRAMLKCQSYTIQLEARRRAMLIKAHIFVASNPLALGIIKENRRKKRIEINVNNKIIHTIDYSLSWWKITLTNQFRKLNLGFYFCEIVPISRSTTLNVLAYLRSQWHWYYSVNKNVNALYQVIKYVIKKILRAMGKSALKIILSPFSAVKTLCVRRT